MFSLLEVFVGMGYAMVGVTAFAAVREAVRSIRNLKKRTNGDEKEHIMT